MYVIISVEYSFAVGEVIKKTVFSEKTVPFQLLVVNISKYIDYKQIYQN